MRLTRSQRATIKDLSRMKIALHVLGVDVVSGCPVVWIKDATRRFPMVVYKDGSGDIPTHGVRLFLEDEKYGLDEADAEVLLRIPFVAEIEPEYLKEERIVN